MTAPLSQDLRRRIAGSVAQGSSIRQAAARYEVSPSAAVKLIQRVRKTGSLAPDRIGGHRRPVLEPHADLLRSLVAAKTGITLAQIQTELKARGIVVAALSTILLTLRRLGLRHKKDTPGGRAGPTGYSACAPALARVAALHGSQPVCVPR